MIVLSFVLVIVAAVTLVIGLFQTDTGLEWIWASIGSCVAAMLFLGIGVLQRRGARPRVASDEVGRPTSATGFSRGPGGAGMSPAWPGDAGEPARAGGTGEPARPGGAGVSPAMPGDTAVSPIFPGSATTPSEPASVTPDEVSIVTGRAARHPSGDVAETEPAQEFVADEPPLVPKRRAGPSPSTGPSTSQSTGPSTPQSTGPSRTRAEVAAERTEEMPAASTRSEASAADAPSAAAASQADAGTRSQTGTKKTTARAAERTVAKKTAAKATKKAATKKSTIAPTARRGTARKATAQDTTGLVTGQAGRAPARTAPEAVGRARAVGPAGGDMKAAKGSKRTARQTTGDTARAELAKIKGLGPAKQEALLREFGSIEAIRAATVEQLTSIRGIGVTTAREILMQARR